MKRIAAYLCLLLLPAWAVALQAQVPQRTAVENIMIDAVSLMDEGRTAEARKVLEYLLGRDRDNDAVRYYLGLCDLREGKPADALGHLEKAAKADPGNLWYKEALASVYSALGRAEEAVGIYSDLMEKDPRKFASP